MAAITEKSVICVDSLVTFCIQHSALSVLQITVPPCNFIFILLSRKNKVLFIVSVVLLLNAF